MRDHVNKIRQTGIEDDTQMWPLCTCTLTQTRGMLRTADHRGFVSSAGFRARLSPTELTLGRAGALIPSYPGTSALSSQRHSSRTNVLIVCYLRTEGTELMNDQR